jgi:hypothetical protein
MKAAVPRFEGMPVHGAVVKLTGKATEKVGSLAYDEEVYFVVRGVVAKVAHGPDEGVFTRIHEVKASALVMVDGQAGERMLDEARMLADERFGIRNLFDNGGDQP